MNTIQFQCTDLSGFLEEDEDKKFRGCVPLGPAVGQRGNVTISKDMDTTPAWLQDNSLSSLHTSESVDIPVADIDASNLNVFTPPSSSNETNMIMSTSTSSLSTSPHALGARAFSSTEKYNAQSKASLLNSRYVHLSYFIFLDGCPIHVAVLPRQSNC